MDENRGFHLEVSGYVSELFCGTIPMAFKEAFTRYLIHNRERSGIPEWLLKSSPHYVSSDQIQKIWYFEDKIMRGLMGNSERPWTTYRGINDLCSLLGFASGKEGIGIFEMGIIQNGRTILEFVPFEPTPDSPDRYRNIDELSIRQLDPPLPPSPGPGYVAVSAGTWAKGVIRFDVPIANSFHPERLKLLSIDLTDLGVGEDHFVSGLAYEEKELVGEVVKIGEREMYPVSWYSRSEDRWRHMHEKE